MLKLILFILFNISLYSQIDAFIGLNLCLKPTTSINAGYTFGGRIDMPYGFKTGISYTQLNYDLNDLTIYDISLKRISFPVLYRVEKIKQISFLVGLNNSFDISIITSYRSIHNNITNRDMIGPTKNVNPFSYSLGIISGIEFVDKDGIGLGIIMLNDISNVSLTQLQFLLIKSF